ETVPPARLVRSDADLDELVALAVETRPDLRSVRLAVEAAAADRSATLWASLSPQTAAGFLYGGITGHANHVVPRQGFPNNLIVNPTTQSGAFVSNPVANGLIREGILRLSQRA